jgi:hypothetical protein
MALFFLLFYTKMKLAMKQNIHSSCTKVPLSITNKMQRYTIFFIAVNALHVSGGFSTHHQELKLNTQRLVYVKPACCYQ